MRPIALITGASSGLGQDFAQLLAARGYDLLLVARRQQRLSDLAERIQQDQPEARCHCFCCDLSLAADRERLFAWTDEQQHPVALLINNAGLGAYGSFLQQKWADLEQTILVDVTALTHLSWHYGQKMQAQGGGKILLLGSVVSFMPVPNYAVYAAAKAQVLSLGHALAVELKAANIQVCTLCPGTTATEFFEVAGHSLNGLQRRMLMSSQEVAKQGLKALFAGKRQWVPGLSNKMMPLLGHLFSRQFLASMAARMTKNSTSP